MAAPPQLKGSGLKILYHEGVVLGLFPNSCCSSILILVKYLTVAHVSSVNLLWHGATISLSHLTDTKFIVPEFLYFFFFFMDFSLMMSR